MSKIFPRQIPLREFPRAALALIASAFFGISAAAGNIATDDQAGVVRATLGNGLKVVIVRNALAPVVATTVNYLVGADETPPGFPGTAHALEHMMFRGSPGLTADQLADIGSLMGGNFNADTRQTVTQYLFTVPADDLDAALHIEALRMRGLLATEQDWGRERGAIEQEVAQDLSNPTYVLYAKLRATMFRGTPYARDALGTRTSFDKTTGAMLKSFHDRWYAPNNAILVIVGNVDPLTTLSKVTGLFGAIPAKQLPQRPKLKLQPVVPHQLSLPTDLPSGMQIIALRMPGLDDPDYAAAEVLADVLGSRRGELYGLVPQGKALDADFKFDPLPKSSLAYSMLAFPAGGDPKALESQARAILAKIARDGVPPGLVAAAKLQERRSAEFQKNSISGLAMVWSEALAVDGLNSPDDDLARIDKVTVEDVNRVARKYLDLDHAVTAVLTPQGSGKAISSRGFGGQETLSLGKTKPAPLPDWAQPLLSHLTVPESTVHPVVTKLANGINLIVQPENVSDTVSVYGHIKNRPELEVPKGKEGVAQILDELFSYGTQRFDRIAFQQTLDAIGAEEHAGTDFSIQALAHSFDRAVELLADNELHPALPESAFNVVRRQISQAVAGQIKSPGYLSGRAFLAALFPSNDPTLREVLPKTVGAVTLADTRDYYHSAFRPDLTTIVVIGKVTPEHAKAVIEKYFGGWTATGPQPATDLLPVPLNPRMVSAVPDASRVQDNVTLGETLALTRSNPDYYALALGNGVLGGAFYSTRLSRDIRKNAGLVYSIQSQLNVGKTRGVYLVGYACDPQNVSRVQNMVMRELDEMQRTPVPAGELQRAKVLLLQRIALGEESVGGIAQGIIERRLLGLPLDEPAIAARRYLGLDAPEVQAAFVKWVRANDLVRVSQGPVPQ